MSDLINSFFLAFIPIFVAMNVFGVVPIFLGLTSNMGTTRRFRLLNEATLTAFAISVIFLATGKFIFSFLGITKNDFRIAGGILLLVISISDVLFSQVEKRRATDNSVGIVPIGVPLIVGPATLTTILILVDQFGYWVTLCSLLANLMLMWFIFRNSHVVVKVMGEAGSKAFAKVASLFLAAIAVMMIRVGLTAFIQ